MRQVYGEGLWVCDYLLIYLYNADEVNKSINWVFQFKTESSWSKCNWFYRIDSDMAKYPLENVALRTFYEIGILSIILYYF